MSAVYLSSRNSAGIAVPAASVKASGQAVCTATDSVGYRTHRRSSACHSTSSDFKQRAISVRTATWAQLKSSSLIRSSCRSPNERRPSSLGGVAAVLPGASALGSFFH